MKTLIRLVLLLAVAGLAMLGFAATAHAAVTPVTPQPPVWHQATCAQPEGSVDIPTQTGVDYALDTIPGLGGQYLLDVGTHTVDATAQPGYVFFPVFHPPVTHWTFTVVAPTGCRKQASVLTNPVPQHHMWTLPVIAGHHRHHHHRH